MLLSVVGKLQAAANNAEGYDEFGEAVGEFRRLSREVNRSFRNFSGIDVALTRAA